jgi:hypothetical protein
LCYLFRCIKNIKIGGVSLPISSISDGSVVSQLSVVDKLEVSWLSDENSTSVYVDVTDNSETTPEPGTPHTFGLTIRLIEGDLNFIFPVRNK